MGLIGRREAARIQFITPATQKKKDYQKLGFLVEKRKTIRNTVFLVEKKKDDKKRGSTGARARAASREFL